MPGVLKNAAKRSARMQHANTSLGHSKHRQAAKSHGGEKSPRLKYLERLIGEGLFDWWTWRQIEASIPASDYAHKKDAWLARHKKRLKGR